ncbi:MAG: phosphoglucosamine mutase, partial [Alphaproteobacteria bacterium]|nr:phosphoglucosamine mutase [Alphaproteobacteria bacterium]
MATARKYFGTDGIRGEANKPPLTPEFALRLAPALTKLTREKRGKKRPQILIGKDTRISGYMLEQALCAGFTAAGADVMLIGPAPTPAVAYLSRKHEIDLGIMISASHNPYKDNGIKIFAHDGYKLADEDELEVEELVDAADITNYLAAGDDIGKAFRYDGALSEYQGYLIETLPHKFTHAPFKAVVDCANGAAYKVAPHLLRNIGVDVVAIHNEPNGKNINEKCGATHLESLQKAVVAEKADIGIALDGDADRLILTDETGKVIDGDQIMALLARGFLKEGTLKKNTLAATVMSNLGLEEFLKEQKIELVRTPVGDRYVVAEMKAQAIV